MDKKLCKTNNFGTTKQISYSNVLQPKIVTSWSLATKSCPLGLTNHRASTNQVQEVMRTLQDFTKLFKAKKMNFSIAFEDAAFIYKFEKGQL